MKFSNCYILFLSVLVALNSCKSAGEKADEAPKYLELKKDQLQSMDITLAPVKVQALQPIVFATGKVSLQPNSESMISSNIGGKIERIHIVEGDFVRAGQSLFTISSMQLIELQQSYLAARNDMNYLKLEHERLTILRQGDIASLSEFQQIEAKYLNAKNMEESLREKLKLIGIDISLLTDKNKANVINRVDIKSPISGSVFKVLATSGSSIEPNTMLATVINLGNIYADIDVYEQDLDQVQLGQEVGIEFINKNISQAKGVVKHIVNAIDPQSRTIKLHVDFDAPKGSIVVPEMAVKVKIVGKRGRDKKITIPMSSILQEGELNYVYYAVPKGEKLEFHKCKVSLGENDGNYTEASFSETLPKDAQVVQSNVYLIDSESKKRVG